MAGGNTLCNICREDLGFPENWTKLMKCPIASSILPRGGGKGEREGGGRGREEREEGEREGRRGRETISLYP